MYLYYTDSKLSFQWRSKSSMKNLPSINDTIVYFLKFSWLQTLCTIKIMTCLKAIPRLNNFNLLLAVCRINFFFMLRKGT